MLYIYTYKHRGKTETDIINMANIKFFHN